MLKIFLHFINDIVIDSLWFLGLKKGATYEKFGGQLNRTSDTISVCFKPF